MQHHPCSRQLQRCHSRIACKLGPEAEQAPSPALADAVTGCPQDIPHDLKAAAGKQEAGAAGQGGGLDLQPHRKELRPPEDPNKAALKAAQGLQASGSQQQQQQQQQEQPNPLGHYFQGGVRKSGQGPPAPEARNPPESPLKYYFTNQIPEEVKAKLALDAAVRAKGGSR